MTVTHADLAAAGISTRRIEYWTRQGWIRTQSTIHPGSGVARQWPHNEMLIALTMVGLINAGFTAPAAASLARTANETASGVSR